MNTDRVYSALTALAALAFALVPFIVPFDGFDPNAYPIPQNSPPAQPAGYAFAIWGPIYLWLLVSTGFGFAKRAENPNWAPTRPPLLISLTIGAIWLPVAQVSPVWATILIWAMLVSALVALFRTPKSDHWLLRAPIGLYAGWLTAASAVSIALLGAGFGIILGQIGWAIVAVTLAFAITASMIIARKAPGTYVFAVFWALIAVIVQNTQQAPLIAAIAAIGAAVLAGLFIYVQAREPR